MSVTLYTGDARAVLATLAPESVHTVVTSPPYWQLRAYSSEPQVWANPDGTPLCAEGGHEWEPSGQTGQRMRNGQGTTNPHFHGGKSDYAALHWPTGAACQRCGAWLGEWGQEPTPEGYVAHTVEGFRAVYRVLRRDGTLWLNLGGTSWNDPGGHNGGAKNTLDYAAGRISAKVLQANRQVGRQKRATGARHPIYKRKDWVPIPWLVAMALQADGWYLRADVIWAKDNPLPESVTDRPTRAHEYVFLLTKSERYYYDWLAIAEPTVYVNEARARGPQPNPKRVALGLGNVSGASQLGAINGATVRNKRSVWQMSSEAFAEAHFATFPPGLVVPCVLASTSAKGCCPTCGAPWRRVTTKRASGRTRDRQTGGLGTERRRAPRGLAPVAGRFQEDVRYDTTDWHPSCRCQGAASLTPVPATVLDPCAGAGTTGLVADRLGRDAILIDVKREYVELARQRIAGDSPLFAKVDVVGERPTQRKLIG